MFFFSNSEKSEIERQYRSYVGNLPYQLPYDLKNKITRAAEELKTLQMHRYEKKTALLRQQEQEEKWEKDSFQQHKRQIEQRWQREIEELTRQYKRKAEEISSRYKRETDSLSRSDQYTEERLVNQIKEYQQEIQNWQNKK
ncbi:hypothetical protein [Candidatus Avelusimicrobium sp.]|uniref:hypothetical protein n=1 Tax=Candidatus Avelusimicrobium sp. TaxID=3048833 RepID=UPI003F80FADD